MNIFFIVSIICLALCFIMFFYLKWYVKKRTSESGLEEYRTEAARLIVDINSVTDRNLQLVEDSISKLKTLLEDTGKRIEEYKNAIEIKPARETLYTNLGRGIRAALINTGEQTPPPPLQTEHPLHSRQLSLEIQDTDELRKVSVKSENKIKTPAAPASEKYASEKYASEKSTSEKSTSEKSTSEKSVSEKPVSKKQIRSAIDLLLNEGLSPEEIASRLEISIAEVNLAMNLRRKKR